MDGKPRGASLVFPRACWKIRPGWRLLSRRDTQWHASRLRSLWVAQIRSQDTLHRMEGVTRMEDILRVVRRALLHRHSHFPAPLCSSCGVAAHCRAAPPAPVLTEALQLVERACCRQCVG